MIASLNGKIVDILNDSLVLDVGGGVGMQVFVPVAVRQQAHIGESLFLHTYLVVRQDALNLFGFESREEREFFLLLLEVNGIGPRLALSVLSVLSPDAIRRAVFHEQADIFSRVPGVGKKTAQKILLQLQDRLPADIGLTPATMLTDQDTEILAALTSLGYSVVEAQTALQSIPRDTPQDLETRLRQALQYFS
jgi:Holliday junction DNA helicase RuvA